MMQLTVPTARPPSFDPPRAPDLLARVRGEYLEMPGLRLTLRQAQRLWGLDSSTCRDVLADLVGTGFLVARADGTYVRHGG